MGTAFVTVPAGQAWHTLGNTAPTTGEKKPSAQGVHCRDDALGANVPALHATHVPPPLVAVPGVHGVHADTLSDPAGDVKPGGQRAQGALQFVQPPTL